MVGPARGLPGPEPGAAVDPFDPTTLFRVVDLTGVVANGLLGSAVARSRSFDLIGFLVLAIASGLGGGMIRDVLLDAGPPIALTDPAYLTAALGAALVGYLLALEGRLPRRLLVLADALALGCWAATGTTKALGVGLEPLAAVILGVVTAVGGGMLRDLLAGRVPQVLGGSTLYATFAVLASLQAALLHERLGETTVMAAAIVLCLVMVPLARRRGWTLPGPVDVAGPVRRRDRRPDR